jgi:hypothetical protein
MYSISRRSYNKRLMHSQPSPAVFCISLQALVTSWYIVLEAVATAIICGEML